MDKRNGFSELAKLMFKNSGNTEKLKQLLTSKYSETDLIAYLGNEDPLVARAAVSALGLIGSMEIVSALVNNLKAEDLRTCFKTENALWEIWSRSGDTSVDAMLNAGKTLLKNEDYVPAVERFTAVIEANPNFAEGYNQRAIAYFMLEEWSKAIQDCKQTLALNPYHFGALAGMGHVYLILGKIDAAIDAYKQALIINPNLVSISETILRLRQVSQGE